MSPFTYTMANFYPNCFVREHFILLPLLQNDRTIHTCISCYCIICVDCSAVYDTNRAFYFYGWQKYTEVTTINMYLLIKIRHNIFVHYHGNYVEVENLQLYAWNWHFKKLLSKIFGCPEGWFWGIGCPKDAQTLCWLRLLSNTTILVINVVLLLLTRWPHGSSQPSQYPTWRLKFIIYPVFSTSITQSTPASWTFHPLSWSTTER